MFKLFTKRKLYQATHLTINESQIHGKGVFAGINFKTGDIVEIAPVILLDKTERDPLQYTSLYAYYYLIVGNIFSICEILRRAELCFNSSSNYYCCELFIAARLASSSFSLSRFFFAFVGKLPSHHSIGSTKGHARQPGLEKCFRFFLFDICFFFLG